MTTSQHDREQQAIAVLAERLQLLRQEEGKMKAALDAAAKSLQRVREEEEAVVRTIRLIEPRWGAEEQPSLTLEAQRFRTMTIPEIAAELAQENSGEILTGRLAEVILHLGRAQAYRNAYASAFSALRRSPRFMKLAKGQFRLIGEGHPQGSARD